MYPLCTCMHVSNVSRHAHIPRMEKNALHAKERTEGEIKKLEQEIKVSQALASDRFLRPCVRAPSHHHANTPTQSRWLRGPSATLMRNSCHSSNVLPTMRCALQYAHRGCLHSGWRVDKHFHIFYVSYSC